MIVTDTLYLRIPLSEIRKVELEKDNDMHTAKILFYNDSGAPYITLPVPSKSCNSDFQELMAVLIS